MSGRRRVVQIVKQLEGRSKLEESILKKKNILRYQDLEFSIFNIKI